MLSQLSYAPICICLSFVCLIPDDANEYITTLLICQYLFESFFEIFKIISKRIVYIHFTILWGDFVPFYAFFPIKMRMECSYILHPLIYGYFEVIRFISF